MNVIPVAAPARARVHFVDNLRVYLTFVVVIHHVAFAYGDIGGWPNGPQQARPDAFTGLLDLLAMLNQTFFMGMFFLLSGYVSPRSLDRKGPRRFAVDRLRRLGVPLLIYYLLLRPLFTLPIYLDIPAADQPPYWRFYLTELDPGIAWFLAVLLLFALAYAAFGGSRPTDPPARPPGTGAAAGPRSAHVVAFAIGLGGISWLWRLVVPYGAEVLELPSLFYLPQYIALFVVGICAYRYGWLASLRPRTGLLGAALLAASLVPMVLGGYEVLTESPPPPTDVAQLSFALWDALFATGTILVLLRTFQRFVDVTGRMARFLSDQALAVYVLHGPVIVGVVAVLEGIDTTAVAKFAIALPVGMVLSWTAAALVRKLPGARSAL
ncbi:acyltransferase [Saccharopolyspora cebuensis]|uniref:Acyltransferase n=1 Tax=Saccharopolyspora cebuensis TaxID=418759 RepID=A0ABV4CH93_9PSEU